MPEYTCVNIVTGLDALCHGDHRPCKVGDTLHAHLEKSCAHRWFSRTEKQANARNEYQMASYIVPSTNIDPIKLCCLLTSTIPC